MSNFSDDLNTSRIAVVGFISVIIVFALIILMQVMFYWAQSQQHLLKDIDQPYLEVANLTADQQARLAKYQWIDEKQKIVGIPIKRAMEIVVDELSHTSPLPTNLRSVPGEGRGEGKKDKSHAQ